MRQRGGSRPGGASCQAACEAQNRVEKTPSVKFSATLSMAALAMP